jgi:hypothetical protein
MSYSINISEHLQNFDLFTNLTVENMEVNKSVLNEYGFDTAEEFQNSDSFYEWQDGYHPIYNFAHILQYSASEQGDKIRDVLENAPNVSILHIEEIDTDLIALNGCGMDMSDSIAYAYMVLDGYVPKSIRPTERMTLSQESWNELQEFLNK